MSPGLNISSFSEDFADTILLAVPSSIALITPEGRNIQEAIDKLLHFVKERTSPRRLYIFMKLFDPILQRKFLSVQLNPWRTILHPC